MSERATCWSVTINNPTASDEDNIAKAKQKSGWKVSGQLEEGENGTRHYQLMVKTPQTRFSALKSAFPRAHIEVARNAKALAEYVVKEDTRIAELPKDNDKFPTMERFYDLFFSFYTTERNNIDSVGIETPDNRLQTLDSFVAYQIEQGSFIESFGVNPQVRSSVKKYLPSIFKRCQKLHRQKTDRQTILISEDNTITDGTEDEESQISETSSCSSSQSTSSTDSSA